MNTDKLKLHFDRRLKLAEAISKAKAGRSDILSCLYAAFKKDGNYDDPEGEVVNALLAASDAIMKVLAEEGEVRIDLELATALVNEPNPTQNTRGKISDSELPGSGSFWLDIMTDGKYTVGDRVMVEDTQSVWTIAGFFQFKNSIEAYIVDDEGKYAGWLQTSREELKIL